MCLSRSSLYLTLRYIYLLTFVIQQSRNIFGCYSYVRIVFGKFYKRRWYCSSGGISQSRVLLMWSYVHKTLNRTVGWVNFLNPHLLAGALDQ